MAEEKKYLQFPGYISVKEAADRLQLKEGKLWYNIRIKKLPAEKIEGRYMILESALKEFQADSRGRVRTEPTPWRNYRAGAKVYALQIEIQPLPGQREALRARLLAASGEQKHQFKGTMLRHIFANQANPDNIIIQLIWKDTELTDEAVLERDLEAFRAEFADALDWGTARYTRLQALIHT